ncbi:hypothetical protein BH23ACT5_BH23ACT5_10170 [soil metagenome]
MTVGTDEWGGLAPSQERKDVPPPPHWRLEAVAAVERPHHLRVSPDGRQLAFILDRADLGSDVWVMSADGGSPRQLTVDRSPTAFWEDTAPAWSPDGAHIAYTTAGWARLVPVEGGPSRPVVEAGAPVWLDTHTLIVGQDCDRSVTETLLPNVTEVSRLAAVELRDPWLRPLTGAGADAGAADGNGRRISYTSYPPDDRNRCDVMVADVDSNETVLVSGTPGVHAGSARWSHDGSRLVFVTEAPGWYTLYSWDGAVTRRLTDGEGDFGAVRWSEDDSRLLTTRTRRGRSELVIVDAESGAVEVLAGGGTWTGASWLPDGSVVAVYEDHATAARIECVGPDSTRRVLFDPAPASVASAPHVAFTEVTYCAPDGLEIHGFLFRPPAADAGPVPAVVYPHGGPTSLYGDEWDGYAQYFLDKGYAWMAINFRGSTSYGRDFERANHGTWGVDDTADCLAAADFLADLNWVDSERIAIFGASYGSYMTVTALTDDPDHRFACGVAKFGDCDILTSWAQGDRVGVEDLERMMGHPSRARDAYRAGSPIHRLDQIERPILVAHGEKDDRVHPRQSEQLVRELSRLQKTFEYVTYPTEGHGLLRREPQLHFYRRLERFFDWYLM